MLFNLLLVFFIVPVSVVILLLWAYTRNSFYGKILLVNWGIVAILLFSMEFLQFLFSKKVLSKSDYYGSYVIDKEYFKGTNADWQFDSFRFEITDKDSIHFHVTDKSRIIQTYNGKINATTHHVSQRLIVEMDEPSHHVVELNPTIYRSNWGFILVFRSSKYHNMYFKKGSWRQ